MKKLRIYLDTSVISYLDQQDAQERMVETHELWEIFKTGKYDIVLSDLTLAEIDDCPETKRDILYNYLRQIEYTTVISNKKSIEIAEQFILLDFLKKKNYDDCQHIANAIVNNCDIIASWNFKHIVNHKTIMGVKSITAHEGFKDLLIYSPQVLIGDDENDL